MIKKVAFPITDSALRWLENIFGERFGHKWQLFIADNTLRLRIQGMDGMIVFDRLLNCLTENHSDQPCFWWDAAREGWTHVIGKKIPAPGVEDLATPLVQKIKDTHFVHYDIVGLIYSMLTRIEEIRRTDLDEHERFPSASSHAFKNNYLDRPLVDEWLHILGLVIQKQWQGLELKSHKFKFQVSHDVDQASSYGFQSWWMIARIMMGHLVKRRDIKEFFRTPSVKLNTQNKLVNTDPYNTFNWLMDVSEENDLRSVFYFICGRTNPKLDSDYNLEHTAIRRLLRNIHNRGHEIGLHPSYDTYKSPSTIKKEMLKLKKVCTEEGIKQKRWGGRMHYLRWKQPVTLLALENSYLDYDSTFGYADRPGFRCGTCHDFQAFDPENQKKLALRLKPLIVMEQSVVTGNDMSTYEYNDAVKLIRSLIEKCKHVKGTFELLWHNSSLVNDRNKKLYKELCDKSLL